MNKFFHFIFILFFLFLTNGCAGGGAANQTLGGSEAGNPNLRTVEGNFNAPGSALMLPKQARVCPANQIIATDAQGTNRIADVDSSCSFQIDLTIGKAYSIEFSKNNSPVANLYVTDRTQALPTTVLIVGQGLGPINLGFINISSRRARPEHEPASQCDSDNDGINDFDDDDDDGDNIHDDDERDCDLDGYRDDFDDNSHCQDNNDISILEVSPHRFETGVEVNEEIGARVGCSVNPASLNSTNFNVQDEGGTPVDCQFQLSESGRLVRCKPAENLLPLQTYTVNVDGLACLSGDLITPITWSFTTGEED